MTMTDPVADMLTRIRNANTAMHDDVAMPSSKLKESLATLLHKEGYINAFNVSENEETPGKTLTIEMKYSPTRARVISGIKRVSSRIEGVLKINRYSKSPRRIGSCSSFN